MARTLRWSVTGKRGVDLASPVFNSTGDVEYFTESALFKEQSQVTGADAVVAVRMETSTIQQAASEVVFYGTAVRLR